MSETRKAVWEVVIIMTLIALGVLTVSTWSPAPVRAQLAATNGFSYAHITTATNTLLKNTQGQLHNITINGGTLTGTITVVDTSASNCTGGTTIAVLAEPQVTGTYYSYDLEFNNGLCVTTAAAVDATVTIR